MSTVPMDNRLQELFSRASTPPQNQPNPTSAAPAAQQPPNNSSSDLIDSLFHHIMVPQDHQSQQSGSLDAPVAVPEPNTVVSAPISPALPLTDEPPTVSSSASAPGTSATTVQERQSALLSLLNQPSSSARLPPAQAAQAAQQPQQIPTPPGSSRSNASPSHTENQKILLEQLMGSAVPRSNVADNQRGPAPSAPSPPYNPPPPRDGEYRPYNQHDQSELSPRLQPVAPGPVVQPPPPSQPTPPAIQQQQQQQFSPPQQTQHVPLPPPQPQAMPQQLPNPPSPRRSMFEFMSPFDHLSSTTGSIKKKPVPTQSASASSTNDDSSWTHVTDPKRQSMENLLDTLTRGAPLQTQPVQAQNNQYEPYVHDHGYPIQPDPYNQARIPPPPLPPKIPVQGPPHRTSSPRGSPPKSQARAPQQPMVPMGVQQMMGVNDIMGAAWNNLTSMNNLNNMSNMGAMNPGMGMGVSVPGMMPMVGVNPGTLAGMNNMGGMNVQGIQPGGGGGMGVNVNAMGMGGPQMGMLNQMAAAGQMSMHDGFGQHPQGMPGMFNPGMGAWGGGGGGDGQFGMEGGHGQWDGGQGVVPNMMGAAGGMNMQGMQGMHGMGMGQWGHGGPQGNF